MKNQYFGDRNDFFKYDLVLELIERSEFLNTFTFIPMLTENDETNDGKYIYYDYSRRPDLGRFLRKCIVHSNRSIQNLKSYMKEANINYIPYRESFYFNNISRNEYFGNIDPEILTNAAILVDPDNGFEVKSMQNKNSSRYIKYSEARMIYNKMSYNSVLVIYQHIPRVNREEYFNKINSDINKTLYNPFIMCLSNNVVAFFIISKSLTLAQETWSTIRKYASQNRYSAFLFCDLQTTIVEKSTNSYNHADTNKEDSNIENSNIEDSNMVGSNIENSNLEEFNVEYSNIENNNDICRGIKNYFTFITKFLKRLIE